MTTLIAELESLHLILEATDPADLAALDGLLQRRNHLLQKLEIDQPPPAGVVDRLRSIHLRGEDLARRMLVYRASLRQQLSGIYQRNFLVRALQADTGPPAGELDCSA